MEKAVIDFNSDKINYKEENNTLIIEFLQENQKPYYTGTASKNTIEIDLKNHLSDVGTVAITDSILPSASNEDVNQIKFMRISPNEQSKMTLTIDRIINNKMTLSFLVVNNTEHELSFENIPYTILTKSGETIYKSQLKDKYEIKAKSYSVFKINIEQEEDFIIPYEGYQILFTN
ncbi:hypothetical protein [Pseudoneobacillus sp. C159]